MPAHLFASADLGHPSGLVAAGRGDRVAAASPATASASWSAPRSATTDKAMCWTSLLDPDVRLGMSTPGMDPSGDYVLKLFAAAERLRPGAGSMLAAKARRLTGTARSRRGAGRAATTMPGSWPWAAPTCS